MVKKYFVFILGLFFLLITSSNIQAAAINLTWEAPEEGGEVEGYVIYASTIRGDYSDPYAMEIIEDVETYGIVSELNNTLTYYFIVVAYNSAGFSDASNEIEVAANSDVYYDDGSGWYDLEKKSAEGCFITTVAYGSQFRPQNIFIMREIVIILMIMMLIMAFGGYIGRRFRVHGSQLKR